ncbi:MAG: antitoxin Xre/MbcA/ParS toxin-binding domain-containing protein [Nitrospira sp.]
MSTDESHRHVRLARIRAYAIDVFGHRDKAANWIQRPNRLLNNTAPIDALDTDIGTESVETILGHIEYGVFS